MSNTPDEKTAIQTGGCDCKSVRYEITGPLRGVIVCHCGQCQRTHGAPAPYSATQKRHLRLTEDRGLKWYASSDFGRRGYCANCGASLFWEALKEDYTSVSAGTLDAPTGLKTIGHIFMDDRGDWYEVNDGLPQYRGTSDGELDGDLS